MTPAEIARKAQLPDPGQPSLGTRRIRRVEWVFGLLCFAGFCVAGVAAGRAVFPHGQESEMLVPDEAVLIAENPRRLPEHRSTAQYRAFQHAKRAIQMLKTNSLVDDSLGREAIELLKKLPK